MKEGLCQVFAGKNIPSKMKTKYKIWGEKMCLEWKDVDRKQKGCGHDRAGGMWAGHAGGHYWGFAFHPE